MCNITAVIWGFGSIVVVYVLEDGLIGLFSNAPEVNQLANQLYPILLALVFFDCVQGIAVGIIKGLGKQGLGSIVTLVGFWAIGLPISLYSVFYLNIGLAGVWYGHVIGVCCNFLFYSAITNSTNWYKAA